jgi:hypothetical protein
MAAKQLHTIENRRSPRRVFRRPVGILLHGDYHVCQALQLGEGGMMAIINIDIPAGTKLIVSLFLPGGGYALIQAEVLYNVDSDEGKAYGMKFDVVPLAQKRFIRNYVSAKTEQEAKEDASA